MDILEIDALSFAARTAQVAAAELYGLLSTGDVAAVADWYVDGHGGRDAGGIEDDIAGMAAYVVRHTAPGETLWRWNRGRGVVSGTSDYAAQPFALRQAYGVFADTVAVVAARLLSEQEAAERQLERDTAPAPAKPKLEDTIFEKEESLGTLRPEAVQAAGQIAARDQALAEERQRKAEERAARKAAKIAAKTRVVPAIKPLAPMSVGETPPQKPVNRGGRGRTKGARS